MSAQAVDPYGDEAACFLLKREQREVEVVARFTVDGEPMSKARARFARTGKGVRTYTPKSTHDAELRMAAAFREVAPGHTDDGTNAYGVMGLFFAGTRQRRDVDNMIKLICDGLNGVAWQDDSQVEEVSGRRGVDVPGNARTEVLIYRVGSVTQGPKKNCAGCGGPFTIYASTAKQKYCSRACAYSAARGRRQQSCEGCGTTFEPAHKQRYCSKPCADRARRAEVTCGHCRKSFSIQRCHVRERNYCTPDCSSTAARERSRSARKGDCTVCGGPVTRKEYKRCAACKRAVERVSGRPGAVRKQS